MDNPVLSVSPAASVLNPPAPHAQPEQNPEIEKFVVFQIDDEFFAVPVTVVSEVAQSLPLTVLPNSPPWLHGVANLRGELLAVINLEYRKSQTKILPKSKIVVFRPSVYDHPIGIVADRICEVVPIRSSAIEPAEDPNLTGRIRLNTNSVGLLDASRLFAATIR